MSDHLIFDRQLVRVRAFESSAMLKAIPKVHDQRLGIRKTVLLCVVKSELLSPGAV